MVLFLVQHINISLTLLKIYNKLSISTTNRIVVIWNIAVRTRHKRAEAKQMKKVFWNKSFAAMWVRLFPQSHYESIHPPVIAPHTSHFIAFQSSDCDVINYSFKYQRDAKFVHENTWTTCWGRWRLVAILKVPLWFSWWLGIVTGLVNPLCHSQHHDES